MTQANAAPADISAWPENLRSPVESILDRVEHALLSAGVRRPVRADLMQNLQATLTQRVTDAAGPAPTPAAVTEALKDFASSEGPPQTALTGPGWRGYLRSLQPRRSRAAFWANVCIALSLVPLIAFLVILAFFSPAGMHVEASFPRERVTAQIGATEPESNATTLFHATGPDGFVRATAAGESPLQRFLWLFSPMSPLALAATLLGLLAVIDILRSRGRVTGLPGALFAALFYPVFLTALTFWLTR